MMIHELMLNKQTRCLGSFEACWRKAKELGLVYTNPQGEQVVADPSRAVVRPVTLDPEDRVHDQLLAVKLLEWRKISDTSIEAVGMGYTFHVLTVDAAWERYEAVFYNPCRFVLDTCSTRRDAVTQVQRWFGAKLVACLEVSML